jgi:hypothetical protein
MRVMENLRKEAHHLPIHLPTRTSPWRESLGMQKEAIKLNQRTAVLLKLRER